MATKFYKVTLLVGYDDTKKVPSADELEAQVYDAIHSWPVLDGHGDVYVDGVTVDVEEFEV